MPGRKRHRSPRKRERYSTCITRRISQGITNPWPLAISVMNLTYTPIDRMFHENEKYKQYHQEVQANKKLKRDPNSPAVPPISQKELLDDLQKQIRERQKQMLVIQEQERQI